MQNLIDEFNPNVVIIMFGANDAQDIKDMDGKTLSHYGDKDWNEKYSKNISDFLNLALARHLSIFWIGNPIARDEYYAKRIENLNSLYKQEVDGKPNAIFISTWDVLKNSAGLYANYLPDETGHNKLARASDGIHTTPFGASMLIDEVFSQVQKKIEFEQKRAD